MSTLRKEIREKRRGLALKFCQEAAKIVSAKVVNTDVYKLAQNVAIYISDENEVNTWNIIQDAWAKEKNCYLPHVTSEQTQLCFYKLTKNSSLVKDIGGTYTCIANQNTIISNCDLDLVIVPLVAFDEYGFRLGRGKGYYDKTFADKLLHPQNKPFLLGLAYEFQKTSFPHQIWDVPLQMIITEKNIYRFAR